MFPTYERLERSVREIGARTRRKNFIKNSRSRLFIGRDVRPDITVNVNLGTPGPRAVRSSGPLALLSAGNNTRSSPI